MYNTALNMPSAAYRPPATFAAYKNLRKGIWIYFFLLIFEGALRKWVLPSFSTPLLIIRDPVAIWLVFAAANKGLLKANFYVAAMLFISVTGIITALLAGHGNFLVAIYGARIFVIHWPLIFVIGKVFNRDDVIQLGKTTLMIAIPMAVLIALQFYSPQSAWVNKAVGGGDEGAGFSGALGYFRPPGTFSFTNGNTLFFSFVAPFVVFFWFNPKLISKLVLVAATIGLVAAIPLSISRSLFFQFVITLFFAALAISRKPKNLPKLILIVIVGIAALFILSKLSFFQTATKAFTTRFEGANKTEGGLQGVVNDRFLGGMAKGIARSFDQPFWGRGIGLGTSVGGTLSLGKAGLQLGEDEWQRILGEMGVLLGLIMIMIRLGTGLTLIKYSYRRLVKEDMLAWLLLSFSFLNVVQGQWGQPTNLGFGIIIGGLNFAALRNSPGTT